MMCRKTHTFSGFFDTVAAVVEEGGATARKVLFGLLFISVTMDEVAATVAMEPLLLIPVIVVVGVNDCGKITCFPGEAGI